MWGSGMKEVIYVGNNSIDARPRGERHFSLNVRTCEHEAQASVFCRKWLTRLRFVFVGCEFGDARLTNRAKNLFGVLSQHPNVSIPSALHSKFDRDVVFRLSWHCNASLGTERIVKVRGNVRQDQRMREAKNLINS